MRCRLRCEAAVLLEACSLAVVLIPCAAQVNHAPPLPSGSIGMAWVFIEHSWRDDHGHSAGADAAHLVLQF
jgi:hypothetical protein